MRVGLWFPEQKLGARGFARAFSEGVSANGDTPILYPLEHPLDHTLDCICIFGIYYIQLWNQLSLSNKPVIFIDVGYKRPGNYFHFSVGKVRPVHYLGKWKKPDDRRIKFAWTPKPWSSETKHILIASSGESYHQFYHGVNPLEWTRTMAASIRKYTDLPVHARLKQPLSNTFNIPVIPGITNVSLASSPVPLREDLQNCYCLITHGSSACIEAILEGVPCITTGHAVARPLSSTLLRCLEFEAVYLASWFDRIQWLNDLAYCTWHQIEWKEGKAWKVARECLEDKSKWTIEELTHRT